MFGLIPVLIEDVESSKDNIKYEALLKAMHTELIRLWEIATSDPLNNPESLYSEDEKSEMYYIRHSVRTEIQKLKLLIFK